MRSSMVLDPEPAPDDLRGGFTDDELTAQALAADPDAPLDPDAVPFAPAGPAFPTLLPTWYMPTPVARVRSRWHVAVVALVLVAFGVINGFGLCITYGHLVIA